MTPRCPNCGEHHQDCECDTMTLQEAEQKLLEAQKEYQEAEAEEQQARSKETAAKNALNQAQKDFDSVIGRIKINSPHGTDWHRERRK